MKHYDYVDWLMYKNMMLSEKKQKEMEQHLYGCDTCMEIFLSLIDEKEEEKAGSVISEDFTFKIINSIPKTKHNKQKIKQRKKAFNYQFGYYSAVASVTIILTLGGFYTNLVDVVPKLSFSVETTTKHSNKIVDFSNRIINSTSSFLFSIENNDMSNRRENNER